MKLSPYIQLSRIEFIVTNRCTGQCAHCSVGDMLNRPGDPPCVQHDAAVDAVRQLCAHYPVTSVMTFGGEPLLYPDVTCAIHAAARDAGVATRQLITNGFFSRDDAQMQTVAEALSAAGVNDLLLSVDAFHQATIPIDVVHRFGEALHRADVPTRLEPSWVVNRATDNPYNAKTENVLSELADLGFPIAYGNDIFLSGRAAKNLAQFYPPAKLDLSECCGAMPYTEPLTHITSLSIDPFGDVTACNFVIGNIYRESITDIVARYDPYTDGTMRALIERGVPGLLDIAQSRGICSNDCRSICDLCRKLAK